MFERTKSLKCQKDKQVRSGQVLILGKLPHYEKHEVWNINVTEQIG